MNQTTQTAGTQPPLLYQPYKSTVRRAPSLPLIRLPETLSDVSEPVYGWWPIGETDNDLTRQHDGEPQGQRIVVAGRVLDESGRPVPNALIEVWQANAAGRYWHVKDDHPAPLDPHFTGAGRTITGADGEYRFTTIKPGAYPWRNHHNAWRPAHIHFSLLGQAFAQRLVTQMYFPDDPLFGQDPIFNAIPAAARHRAVSRFSLERTQDNWALAFEWDIVLRGTDQTPMETDDDGDVA